MRSIIGLTPPATRARALERGRHQRAGEPIGSRAPASGSCPRTGACSRELTVHENLDVARRASGRRGRWTIDTVCALFPKLVELRDRRAGFLSGGEQQMLTIGAHADGAIPSCCCSTSRPRASRRSSWRACSSRSQRLKQRGPDDPARRTGRRVLARARRSRLRAREGRRRPRGSGGRAARRCSPARQVARRSRSTSSTSPRRTPCHS